MNRTLKSLFVAALLAGVAESQAQVVFTFDGAQNGFATFTLTQGGITLSASDANGPSGKFGSEATAGLFISGDNSYGQTTFKFSFDTPVRITHYQVGDANDASGVAFDLARTSGTAGTPSANNDLSTVGSFSINGTFNVNANQEITFTSNAGFSAFSQLRSFTVVSAVPEPAETTAIAAGVCGLVAFAARRRFGRATTG